MDSHQVIQYTTADNARFSLLKDVLNKTANANVERPFHPDFSTEQSRLASYNDWPSNLTQQPDELAKAGFYYYGMKDMVKCFFCNGGLSNWESGDVPIEEHTRWFPKCAYIRQLMGVRYLEEMREKFKDVDSGFRDDYTFDTSKYYQSNDHDVTPATHAPRSNVQSITKERDVSPTVVLARLDLPAIRKIIDLGFKKVTVKRAIEKKLAKDGDDFKNLVDLVAACYNIEENDKKLENKLKSTFDLALFNVSKCVDKLDVYNLFSNMIHIKPTIIKYDFI